MDIIKWGQDSYDHGYSSKDDTPSTCPTPELMNYQRDLITYWELPETTIEDNVRIVHLFIQKCTKSNVLK